MATGAWGMQMVMNSSGMFWQDLGGAGAGRQLGFKGFFEYVIGDNTQIDVINGASTVIKTGTPAAGWPLRISDGAGHQIDLYNSGANGALTMTDLPAGNFNMVINLVTHSKQLVTQCLLHS